jgi:hypothetical protein
MRFARFKYDFAVDGGAIATITPAQTDLIKANCIIMGGVIDVITTVTSLGSATIAIGTSAGSASNSLLTATAKPAASLINSVATFAAAVKMTADGVLTLTVGTAALTAGVVEGFFFYIQAVG